MTPAPEVGKPLFSSSSESTTTKGPEPAPVPDFDPKPAAAPEPTPAAAPAAPVTKDTGGLDDSFFQELSGKPEEPAAATGDWNADEWLKQHLPDKDAFPKEQGPAFEKLREALAKAAEENRKLVESRPELEKEISSKYADYEELKARQELWNNDAFAAEHQQAIGTLRDEQRAILEQAGLDASLVDKAANIEGEFKLARFWHDNVKDEVARQLLVERGREMQKRLTGLQGAMKAPLDAVERWREEAAARSAQTRQHQTQEATARVLAMAPQIAQKVAETNPVLRTRYGADLLQQIQQEFASNAPLPQEQLIEERIQARTVPGLVAYVERLQADLAEAKQSLQQYEGLQPRHSAADGGNVPTKSTGGGLFNFDVPSTSGGLFKSQG